MGQFGLITKVTFKIYAAQPKQEILKGFPPFPTDELFKRVKKEIDPDGLFIIEEKKN